MKDYSADDYIKYRLMKANETLEEIKVLLENRFWNTAVNRMYYACFYAVGALLSKNKVEVSSHSGSRQKFGQLYIQTGVIGRDFGKHYSELFEKRQKGDYNDFFDIDEETALRLYPPTVDFIKELEKTINE
jgi:uncharacterized protein (UPF0332 family)